MGEIIKVDAEYLSWIASISEKFKRSQIKAASKVNTEMLRFYFSLGGEISSRDKDNHYGSSFYDRISADLRRALPDARSFSPTNLKYMTYFYELYKDLVNRPQVEDDSKTANHPQRVDDFTEVFFMIPWGHNRLIIDKCKGDQKKALFFVRQTLENNWSRAVLMNFLDTELYERQGKAISNFDKVLPSIQSDLAQEMTKDPYNFDFLAIRKSYDEKELKDALMQNVQSFLMELGKGFAFVGREYRLIVGRTEQFVDMLFYNIPNHCYVVVEVKVREFEPGDMGQLGTYIGAVDGILKGEGDNQTVGLLICRTKDNVLAQYAVNMINAPIGISEYELTNVMPDELKYSMPTIEEIENELKNR